MLTIDVTMYRLLRLCRGDLLASYRLVEQGLGVPSVWEVTDGIGRDLVASPESNEVSSKREACK